MAKDDLDDLIEDLDVFTNQNKLNVFLKDEIDGLIASALEEIGIRQIMDTGQARSIFVDIARDYLGIDFSYIYSEPTDRWGNLDRGRDVYNFEPYNVLLDNSNGRFMDFEIYDYGVLGQEEGIKGKQYPSQIKPYSENYEAGHLTTVSELAESGNLAKFEVWVNLIQDKIINKIEGR